MKSPEELKKLSVADLKDMSWNELEDISKSKAHREALMLNVRKRTNQQLKALANYYRDQKRKYVKINEKIDEKNKKIAEKNAEIEEDNVERIAKGRKPKMLKPLIPLIDISTFSFSSPISFVKEHLNNAPNGYTPLKMPDEDTSPRDYRKVLSEGINFLSHQMSTVRGIEKINEETREKFESKMNAAFSGEKGEYSLNDEQYARLITLLQKLNAQGVIGRDAKSSPAYQEGLAGLLSQTNNPQIEVTRKRTKSGYVYSYKSKITGEKYTSAFDAWYSSLESFSLEKKINLVALKKLGTQTENRKSLLS